MNNQQFTNRVKHEAISKTIGDMMQHTCMYNPTSLTRFGELIEPNIDALNQFRLHLANIGEMLYQEDYEGIAGYIDVVVKPWIVDVGSPHGNFCGVWFDRSTGKLDYYSGGYTTGVWSVRFRQMDDITDIIAIETIPNLLHKTVILYDLVCEVVGYETSIGWLWYELKPVNPEKYGFKIDFSWRDLVKGDLKGLIININ